MLPLGVRDVEHLRHHDEREDAERHVDEEHPAPAGDAQDLLLAGEEAARQRAEHRRRAEDGHEVALVPGALAGCHDVTDDRQRQREQPARAQALDRPERRQLVHRVGERARHRADHEDRDRGEEQRLAPEQVRQLAVERRGDRGRDQVRRGGPGLQAQAVEVVGDGPDGRADDRLVERGQEHADHQTGEDRQDLPVGQ